MNGSAFGIHSARPDEIPQVASTIAAAFIADPFARVRVVFAARILARDSSLHPRVRWTQFRARFSLCVC